MLKKRWLAAGVAILGLALFTGCGSGDDENSNPARDADITFASGMVPHHQSAVDMAEIALQESNRPEIRNLAKDVIRTQNAEIDQLQAAVKRLSDEGDTNASGMAGMDHDMSGMDGSMTAEEMGMNMNPDDLRGAKPFDREFIDMMIPHHQGAIRMARIQLAEGEDAELKQLSEAVIAAQSKEINQMNRWRKQWYGASSPAGGIPAEDDTQSDSGM